jgi:hypothetical protein
MRRRSGSLFVIGASSSNICSPTLGVPHDPQAIVVAAERERIAEGSLRVGALTAGQ